MVDLNGKLRAHRELRSKVVRIGAERTPVLVIDDFLSDAQLLVDYAAAHSTFTSDPQTHYPGVRAPIPPIYAFAVRAFLGPLIRQAFGLGNSGVIRERADFSIVTTPPAALSVPQRMPHIDNTDPGHFAVLHYLCGPHDGGTSFYRHRASGFEAFDAGRLAAYGRILEAELAAFGPPPARYADGEDLRFERIAAFPAAFNRVLVYPGRNLHSADIAPDFRFDPDPRTGRLTANSFFYFA